MKYKFNNIGKPNQCNLYIHCIITIHLGWFVLRSLSSGVLYPYWLVLELSMQQCCEAVQQYWLQYILHAVLAALWSAAYKSQILHLAYRFSHLLQLLRNLATQNHEVFPLYLFWQINSLFIAKYCLWLSFVTQILKYSLPQCDWQHSLLKPVWHWPVGHQCFMFCHIVYIIIKTPPLLYFVVYKSFV